MYNRNARAQGGGKVCDYFLQGRCRYGDNCKFEHPGAQQNASNNRFSALSDQASSTTRQADPRDTRQQLYSLNKDIIVADLKSERPQWPLSAYGPGREAPRQLFGGYPLEQSPEEMRVLFYLAQAAGNTQPAIQAEQSLLQQMNAQVEKAASDPEGAIQYIIAGENDHPNRIGMTQKSNVANQAKPGNPFSSAASTGGFGQPSALGASKPTFGTAAFGQPSQLAASSSFGQASQSARTSTFGQPSQPGAASAFGQPSQIGVAPGFGLPPRTTNVSTSTLPSGSSGTTAFGQTSQIGSSSAFGQPSTLGAVAQKQSTFGQPSNPFSSQASTGGFGQANNQNLSPFAGAAQSGSSFGTQNQAFPSPIASAGPAITSGPGQNTPVASGTSAFGKPSTSGTASNPFSQPQQSSVSPFAQAGQQAQANTSAFKSPFATTHAHPPLNRQSGDTGGTATPSLDSYARISNGRLQTWQGRPVVYIDSLPYYAKNGNTRDNSSLERIWFAEGAPSSNPYTAESDAAYDSFGSAIEQEYRTCAEHGRFEAGIPLLAPKRAWTRFDI